MTRMFFTADRLADAETSTFVVDALNADGSVDLFEIVLHADGRDDLIANRSTGECVALDAVTFDPEWADLLAFVTESVWDAE